MRKTTPTRDNEIEREEFFHGGGHFSPSNWRVPSHQGYDGWGAGRYNRLDQHKAFGKLARVKPISQSKLNTQRNEPADVISSYPS